MVILQVSYFLAMPLCHVSDLLNEISLLLAKICLMTILKIS